MSEHISSVSKSCFMSIRDLCRIRNTFDSSQTASYKFQTLLSSCLPMSRLGTTPSDSVFSRFKITDRSFTHHALLFQKNFANLPFNLLTLVNKLALLFYYLINLHLTFTSSLKLNCSTNHFLLSVSRIDVTSLALLTWLPDFHLTFIFVVSSSTISFTCFTACSIYVQCLGISLH